MKYLARFIPNLSKITAELRNLTRLGVKFEWNRVHEAEFRNLLTIVASGSVLVVCSPGLPVIRQMHLEIDWSVCWFRNSIPSLSLLEY